MWCKRELCKQAIASVKGSEASADDDTAAAANACRAIENLELTVDNLQALVLCNSSQAAKGGLTRPARESFRWWIGDQHSSVPQNQITRL